MVTVVLWVLVVHHIPVKRQQHRYDVSANSLLLLPLQFMLPLLHGDLFTVTLLLPAADIFPRARIVLGRIVSHVDHVENVRTVFLAPEQPRGVAGVHAT